MNYSSKSSDVLLLGTSSLFGSAFSKILNSKKIKFDAISKSIPKQKLYNNFLKCDFNNELSFSKISNFLKNDDNKYKLIVFFNGIQGPKKNINLISNKEFNKILTVNCFSLIKMFYLIESNQKINNNALIIFFSSRAGSISERGKLPHHIPGGDNIYRISKSALNSYVKNISFEFIEKNYKIISYHPGWLVKKENKNSFHKDYKYYMNSFLKIINNNRLKTGSFYNYDGKRIPW